MEKYKIQLVEFWSARSCPSFGCSCYVVFEWANWKKSKLVKGFAFLHAHSHQQRSDFTFFPKLLCLTIWLSKWTTTTKNSSFYESLHFLTEPWLLGERGDGSVVWNHSHLYGSRFIGIDTQLSNCKCFNCFWCLFIWKLYR